MLNILRFPDSKTNFHSIELIKHALEALQLEIDPAKAILVAGTNGKGSTCATLQKLLQAAGKNVGLFSSPHLITINERIKFNDKDISNQNFREVFAIVKKKVQNFNLSPFEYLTLMAAQHFFTKKNIDFAIFEVGLGGSLDATNAIPHGVSVVTRLGMDHESMLGNHILEIAKNKLGIISCKNKVFHTQFPDTSVAELARLIAKKFQAELVEAYPYDCTVDTTGKYPLFQLKTRWGDYALKLQGRRAAENTALALTVFDHLIDENVQQFLPAIGEVNWPGRMEMITYKNHDVFLSGDHNPQGIQSLLDILQFYNFRNVHFVVGICADKKHSEMLQKLTNYRNSYIYLTETPNKTLYLKNYDEVFRKLAKIATKNPLDALNTAIASASEKDLVIVTGSLYLIGKIKTLIKMGIAQ
ncbi:MAG: hypothetical protein LBE95_00880 [Holosporaceae bacterium]|jgi:dihydrofolate synthase/folylpolyglutamate synthase|nr:hypothetical protein [Holosporaceae bacterium]